MVAEGDGPGHKAGSRQLGRSLRAFFVDVASWVTSPRLAEMKEHTQHRACDISSLIVFDPTEPGVPEAAIPGLGLGHSEDLMSA